MAKSKAKPRRRIVIDVKAVGRSWRVEWRGYGRGSTYSSKAAALARAVGDAELHEELGGLAQVMVFNRAGRFQEERTYGADPRNREG